MSTRLATIPKYSFYEPKNNLPTMSLNKFSPEEKFTRAFVRAYAAQAVSLHRRSAKTSLAFAMEIPVNGYGITDLLAIAWDGIPDETFPSALAFAKIVKPTCRAFEMKLANWQKALSQASRYRNFAHQPIVVLPPKACDNAMRALDTFKLVRVGLWSFDPKTRQIRAIFTPRVHKPRSERYWLQSIEKAASAPNSTLPILGRE
jgi:hypothetical protein